LLQQNEEKHTVGTVSKTKNTILLEQFQNQKQKIPYCWNSFKIKNKNTILLEQPVSKSKTKNTILLEQPVSNSKTKNTILLEQFQNQKQKYHTVGTVSKSKSEKEAKRYP
jgi:hypothetical protein